MIMRKIVFFLMTIPVFGGVAQTDEAVKHPVLNEDAAIGIYTTFEQFKSNKPDPEYFLNIDPTKNIETASLRERAKGIPVITSNGEETGIRPDKMYAYCDGQDIYIAYGIKFYKLEDSGLFSIFTYVSGASTGSYGTASTNSQDYVVDMNTGKIFVLNSGAIKNTILIDYPDLYEKYKKDKMKSTMIRWYVTEANKRAKGE